MYSFKWELLSYLRVEVAQLLKAVELVKTPFLNMVCL